jgi:hypothetical protein
MALKYFSIISSGAFDFAISAYSLHLYDFALLRDTSPGISRRSLRLRTTSSATIGTAFMSHGGAITSRIIYWIDMLLLSIEVTLMIAAFIFLTTRIMAIIFTISALNIYSLIHISYIVISI